MNYQKYYNFHDASDLNLHMKWQIAKKRLKSFVLFTVCCTLWIHKNDNWSCVHKWKSDEVSYLLSVCTYVCVCVCILEINVKFNSDILQLKKKQRSISYMSRIIYLFKTIKPDIFLMCVVVFIHIKHSFGRTKQKNITFNENLYVRQSVLLLTHSRVCDWGKHLV